MKWEKLVKSFPQGKSKKAFSRLLKDTTTSARANLGGSSELVSLVQNAPQAERREVIVSHLKKEVMQTLRLEAGSEVDIRRGLMSMGIDSLMAVQFRNKLKAAVGEEFGKKLPATLLFNHPTIEALANFILSEVLDMEKIPSKSAPVTIKKNVSKNDPIAIVGIGCRFPGGANSPETFWKNLTDGINSLEDIPLERFDLEQVYS